MNDGGRRRPARLGHTIKRALATVHLWIGVTFCLPFAVLGVTGSILVFEHEIEDVLVPERPRAEGQGVPRPLSEVVASAARHVPSSLRPAAVAMPEEPGGLVTVRFSEPGRSSPRAAGARRVMVDPVSLGVMEGEAVGRSGFLRGVFRLHANLLAGREGRDVIGWLGIGMLFLGVSGLVLWWPRRATMKSAFKVSRGATGYRLHRELHGAVGFWELAVFVVVTFSGVYLCFPSAAGDAVRSVFPGRDLRAAASAISVVAVEGAQPMGLDETVATAQAALPGAELHSVFYPAEPERPWRLRFRRPGDAERGAPSISVFVDPWSRRIIDIMDPRDYTIGETITAWQHAVHAGRGMGWAWKVLVFLSGALPVLFAITGCSMWLLKRRLRRPGKTRPSRRPAG